MRLHPIFFLITLLCAWPALSQRVPAADETRYKIAFRSGAFTPKKNIDKSSLDALDKKLIRANGKSLVLLQFEVMPGRQERQQLKNDSTALLEYISGNAYLAVTRSLPKEEKLKSIKIRAMLPVLPEQKMQPALIRRQFPAHAVKKQGTVDVWISSPSAFQADEVKQLLLAKNIELLPVAYEAYGVLALRIPAYRLQEIAAEPYVLYMQAAPKEDELLNTKSTALARANVLKSSLPGGRGLTGDGVVIGVGDDANPHRHIDFDGRVINHNAAPAGSHGVHVMGTAAGAGIRDERFEGYAPRAGIVAQYVSGILANAPAYVQDYNMVVTNNSYGNIVDDCESFGVYDIYSHVMDRQAIQLPHLQHVFAAGNSGSYSCAPYAAGYSNVLGGYQTAKNVIVVGGIDELGIAGAGYSKGPVRDGRIKPEITAQAIHVRSAIPVNGYGYSSGTSMSAPAVAGGLALLYERYRQLHSGADPDNGLMKALLCNGAADAGNPGPDFVYGFGMMNLLRSVNMLEQNNYFIQNISHGNSQAHQVTVGAGVAELKVMLYWNDAPASPLAASALINDLDLTVTGPGGTFYPQLPDTTPPLVGNAATTGADHVNNIEQVVIKNPVPGNYTFTVNGYRIPGGDPYKYYLVFDTLSAGITLTNPVGGERFVPGDSLYLTWDAYGNEANDFSLSFSPDNGATWSDIQNNIPAAVRQHKWFVPAIAAGQARIKLVQNGTGLEQVSAPFTILGMPVVSLAAVQCEGYIAVNWTAVPDATDYEVSILRNGEMVPVATTAANTYTFSGLSKDTAYWVSVCARYNGSKGRRALAVTRQPNAGTCAGAISDNDLKVDAILSPVSGRQFTSTALIPAAQVRVRIKNLDNAAKTGFLVKYAINGGAFIPENNTAPIASLGTYTHTFSVPADLSAIGDYLLTVVVENLSGADPVSGNDTLRAWIRHLPNDPVTLIAGGASLLDDVETAMDTTYHQVHTGLYGADRYDFTASTVNGRLRTFVSSGMAYSGSKAFTLDSRQYIAAGVADSLRATFNLGAYTVAGDDIRLDFMYKHHNQVSNAANRVWIRGNDQQPWLPLYDLYAGQGAAGVFKQTRSLEISDLLMNNGQELSSSFQVRWGQWGQYITADNLIASGYTFDDIHLYKVVNDLQLISIDTPVVVSCGLSSATPVRVTIRNSATNSITNIPVKLQLNNGAVITETIPSIPAKANLSYTFNATVNMAATGQHVLKVWTDFGGDSYKNNDTATLGIYHSPVINTYPYLQDFESGENNWRAEGQNSSWQLGTPASVRIKGAASGVNAWKTSLAGSYNDREHSYLYSPCFDISGLANPMLSFSIALDIEDCGTTLCDAAWVEYSVDGINWSRLGNTGEGTNWYNRTHSGLSSWSVLDYHRWHVASIPLPAGSYTNLRLRFVMQSDPYVSREGIAIDDIHIFDKGAARIYDRPPYESNTVSIASPAAGNWNYFTQGDQLIAAMHPGNQSLGNTTAKAYIYEGDVRDTLDQYYHSRNIVIQPAGTAINDSIAVRFYFLDKETDSLLFASGCDTCARPSSAYRLGVAVYNDAVGKENGILTDNAEGTWSFIPYNRVRIVPYDKGYYAEFKTRSPGEFWLAPNPFTNASPPLAVINSFTAVKTANQADVLVQWQMGQERHIDKYEVEVAVGNIAFQQNDFHALTIIAAGINSQVARDYQFTDTEPGKAGVRYYRLKITDRNGNITYSEAIPVVFTTELSVQVYPNPSPGIVNLVYQFEAGSRLRVAVYDINGRVVYRRQLQANAFIQKEEVDLSALAAGLYLIEVQPAAGEKKIFRLLRQ